MFNWLKPKTEMYIEQLASFDYSQLELEYAYKKSGGKTILLFLKKKWLKWYLKMIIHTIPML